MNDSSIRLWDVLSKTTCRSSLYAGTCYTWKRIRLRRSVVIRILWHDRDHPQKHVDGSRFLNPTKCSCLKIWIFFTTDEILLMMRNRFYISIFFLFEEEFQNRESDVELTYLAFMETRRWRGNCIKTVLSTINVLIIFGIQVMFSDTSSESVTFVLEISSR